MSITVTDIGHSYLTQDGNNNNQSFFVQLFKQRADHFDNSVMENFFRRLKTEMFFWRKVPNGG